MSHLAKGSPRDHPLLQEPTQTRKQRERHLGGTLNQLWIWGEVHKMQEVQRTVEHTPLIIHKNWFLVVQRTCRENLPSDLSQVHGQVALGTFTLLSPPSVSRTFASCQTGLSPVALTTRLLPPLPPAPNSLSANLETLGT